MMAVCPACGGDTPASIKQTKRGTVYSWDLCALCRPTFTECVDAMRSERLAAAVEDHLGLSMRQLHVETPVTSMQSEIFSRPIIPRYDMLGFNRKEVRTVTEPQTLYWSHKHDPLNWGGRPWRKIAWRWHVAAIRRRQNAKRARTTTPTSVDNYKESL